MGKPSALFQGAYRVGDPQVSAEEICYVSNQLRRNRRRKTAAPPPSEKNATRRLISCHSNIFVRSAKNVKKR